MTAKPSKPELVLVKPSVSVFSKSTIKLLIPQGWYCLKGKVPVFSAVDIQIDCRANLASSGDGATVMGSNDRRGGVTVFGNSNLNRIGCDKTNSLVSLRSADKIAARWRSYPRWTCCRPVGR